MSAAAAHHRTRSAVVAEIKDDLSRIGFMMVSDFSKYIYQNVTLIWSDKTEAGALSLHSTVHPCPIQSHHGTHCMVCGLKCIKKLSKKWNLLSKSNARLNEIDEADCTNCRVWLAGRTVVIGQMTDRCQQSERVCKRRCSKIVGWHNWGSLSVSLTKTIIKSSLAVAEMVLAETLQNMKVYGSFLQARKFAKWILIIFGFLFYFSYVIGKLITIWMMGWESWESAKNLFRFKILWINYHK